MLSLLTAPLKVMVIIWGTWVYSIFPGILIYVYIYTHIDRQRERENEKLYYLVSSGEQKRCSGRFNKTWFRQESRNQWGSFNSTWFHREKRNNREASIRGSIRRAKKSGSFSNKTWFQRENKIIPGSIRRAETIRKLALRQIAVWGAIGILKMYIILNCWVFNIWIVHDVQRSHQVTNSIPDQLCKRSRLTRPNSRGVRRRTAPVH